ncbi:transporter [Photobacterium sanctipauli]|uniref:Transporter n=3 Tax=Photobacterium sanctipauli TaxID=1342794 RepID=A0A2T3NVD8_9GAMM|nr:NCS1 family transporter [Photobacterium sanctipauli]PSW20201.1 transporter [Photobacterium sanctipauli]
MSAQQTSIEPIADGKDRILGPKAYIAMWWGDAVMVGAFMLGSSLIPPFGEMNLWQAITVLVIANILVAMMLAINGRAGWKHGIPMIVQLRSSFGHIGSRIPGFLRGFPALFWYGIQTWLGAQAINSIMVQTIGFDNVWLWFFAFQAVQIWISAKGMESIKWVEIVGAVFIMLGLVYLLFLFLDQFGLQVRAVGEIEGTWALPFWLGITALTGNFSALFLNVSDYTRFIPRKGVSEATYVNAHVIGVLPPSILMPFIGIMGAAAVGIWNPVDVISQYIPMPIVSVFILFFIALAQVTTNLVANIIPPAIIAMDIFKISWARACVIIGVLAVFTCPWLIMQADFFLTFVAGMSAFLGPLLGIMLVDYYIIHKGHYNVDALYEGEMFGKWRKINPAAVIAATVGAVLALFFIDLSWFVGTITGATLYYALMRYWVVNHDSYTANAFAAGKQQETVSES